MTVTLTASPVLVATPTGAADVPAALRLVAPLPGLPGPVDYVLEPLDELGVLFALRATDPGARAVRLFVVAPHAFFPGYAPALGAAVLETVGTTPDEAVLLVVVHPAGGDEPPTANLLAPLVVDRTSGRAAQVVLEEDLPLRAPVG